MTTGEIIQILYRTAITAVKLGGPPLILSMTIGVLISIIQAATQIQEQTLTFVPKVCVILTVLLSGSSWMLASVQDFFYEIFSLMQ